jgi:RNA 2',3'-cyclic 3'-phosphodiesterase
MRLFIGTTIPEPLITKISAVAQAHLQDPSWRVAPAGQWHVTALFIGERPEHEVALLKDHVAPIAEGTPKITLHNGVLLTMPERSPRMLWIRFDVDPALTALHLTLATALDAEPSRHLPYQPHITLARSRGRAEPVSATPVIEELVLDHLTLFRTELHSTGSIHHPLATWPLN